MCACDMQLCGFGPMCAGLTCGLMNMSMCKCASTLEYMCVCLCAIECMSVCFVFCVHEPLYMQLQDYVCVCVFFVYLCLFAHVCQGQRISQVLLFFEIVLIKLEFPPPIFAQSSTLLTTTTSSVNFKGSHRIFFFGWF